MTDIDQNKEIESYKLLRELSAKTKKISLLERRILKLEMHEKSSKLQSYQEKLDFELKIKDEIDLQTKNIDKFLKEDLVSNLYEFQISQDSTDIIKVLEKQLISIKKQEQNLCSKYSSVLLEKEKLKNHNEEMQQIIRNLEKEIAKLLNNNDKNSDFDIFIKEIEDLKHKISKYDSERKDLIKSLDTQAKT